MNRQIRIYYLDAAGVIQEYCYTSGTGWYVGDLGGSVYEANPKAGLAAVTWADPNMDVQDIRVYYQGEYYPYLVRYLFVEAPKSG